MSRISRWSKKGSGSRARSRLGGSFSSVRCSAEPSEIVVQIKLDSGSLHCTEYRPARRKFSRLVSAKNTGFTGNSSGPKLGLARSGCSAATNWSFSVTATWLSSGSMPGEWEPCSTRRASVTTSSPRMPNRTPWRSVTPRSCIGARKPSCRSE